MSSPKEFDHVAVIIPSFNEGAILTETVKSVKSTFKHIIVVDDGSFNFELEQLSLQNIEIVRHPINLGQGAAIQTGIEVALTIKDVNYFLTFDADGQHSVNSAKNLVSEIRASKVDIVLGTRFSSDDQNKIPLIRKMVLKLAILFTRIESGLKVTDTHNGLRVFNRKFAEAIQIQQNGMAHASEILNFINKHDFSWKETPVEIIYTEYSKQKGQSSLNAINIITELMHK